MQETGSHPRRHHCLRTPSKSEQVRDLVTMDRDVLEFRERTKNIEGSSVEQKEGHCADRDEPED